MAKLIQSENEIEQSLTAEIAPMPTKTVNTASQQDVVSLSLTHFLPYRLVNLAQSVSDKFAEVYQQDFNLTIPEWRILVHLAAHTTHSDKGDKGDVNQTQSRLDSEQETAVESSVNHAIVDGLSAKSLTVLASMDKSTVSRAVKLMLEKGYLAKHLDSSDKRASLLTLTPTGLELYHAIAPKALKWEAGLLDVLSASEYRDLMRIIDKLDKRLA